MWANAKLSIGGVVNIESLKSKVTYQEEIVDTMKTSFLVKQEGSKNDSSLLGMLSV